MMENNKSTKETDQTENKNESGKPALDNDDLPRKESQEESVKAEEDTPSEVGKESERSREDAASEAQEQEETLSQGEK